MEMQLCVCVCLLQQLFELWGAPSNFPCTLRLQNNSEYRTFSKWEVFAKFHCTVHEQQQQQPKKKEKLKKQLYWQQQSAGRFGKRNFSAHTNFTLHLRECLRHIMQMKIGNTAFYCSKSYAINFASSNTINWVLCIGEKCGNRRACSTISIII